LCQNLRAKRSQTPLKAAPEEPQLFKIQPVGNLAWSMQDQASTSLLCGYSYSVSLVEHPTDVFSGICPLLEELL